MATTSLSLGPYFEKFIKQQVESGRYATASEVIRDALREMDEREKQLAALRAHLAEGEQDITAGRYTEDFDVDELIEEALSEE